MSKHRLGICLGWALSLLACGYVAAAEQKYDPGASDTEIKIGNTAPYSGPASALSVMFRVVDAYFRKINDEGGINGRKLKFISYDDAYSPPKTVEQTRKLVEGDEVLLMFGSLGSPTNAAVQKYLNAKKVPQLFVMAAATRFGNPAEYPWTMPWPLDLQSEGRIAAAYLEKNLSTARIAVIYQNDDFGRDVLSGFTQGLGERKSAIVMESSYETTDPTIDSAIVKAKASGADVLFVMATPKFSAMAIRRVAELGWKPTIMVPQNSASIGAVLTPAGLENSVGVTSWVSFKDATDPVWSGDRDLEEWSQFMSKYYPEGNRKDGGTVSGYILAETLVSVLRAAGDDISRENIMRKAASMKDVKLGMLLPGMTLNTAPDDYFPTKQARVVRFNGTVWEPVGDLITTRVSN
jgi:branched-chain amino acid transport system substrate-binding protein